MRILLVNFMETTAPGGINKTVQEIATHLVKFGNRVTILQDNALNLDSHSFHNGYEIIRISSNFGKVFYGMSYEVIIYLKNNIKYLNPDIIHVHGYATFFSTSIIIYLRKFLKISIPIVFSPHYGTNSHDTFAGKHLWNIYSIYGKLVFKYADVIICASHFERENVLKCFNLDPCKLILIPHGVDQFRQLTKDKKDKIRLLYAGYLLELKGIQFILYAINVLIENYNIDVKLTIIGDGNYKNKLLKLARSLSIQNHIEWYQFFPAEKLYEEYMKSDIFILLSVSENYGIVVAESLAHGTPCIVAKTTALNEFINEPGCFGIEYPPNPKDLADLIVKITKNRIEVGPFSNKIRTWDKVVEDYQHIYIDLVNLKSKDDNVKENRAKTDELA